MTPPPSLLARNEARKAARAYFWDCAILLFFLPLTWLVLIHVLREVLGLVTDFKLKLVIGMSAVLAGVFATSALIAVLAHLRRNRERLYREDSHPR